VRPRRLIDYAVGLIVKRGAERARLDPAPFSGHSLRTGLVTSAYASDIREHVIQAQTRHQSERMLRSYKRTATLFTQNASGKVGLVLTSTTGIVKGEARRGVAPPYLSQRVWDYLAGPPTIQKDHCRWPLEEVKLP
jgi:hypothetical protein